MDILMTGDAAVAVQEVRFGFFSGRRVLGIVALLAVRDLTMSTNQWIAGLVVVEVIGIPTDHWDVFALMLAVTLEAVVLFLGVETGLHLNPIGKLLVTVETFCGCKTRARRVTLGAVSQPHQIGMRFMKGPGRHQEIELLRCTAAWSGEHHEAKQEPPSHHPVVPRVR